jgi:pimeloyl-ACP methyl ester carboxylesterase
MIVYHDFNICDKFDTLEKTHSINIPCLIIVGKYDKLTPVKYSNYFLEKIKNSELAVIDDAGHMVMVEKPLEFNKALENYLNNYL